MREFFDVALQRAALGMALVRRAWRIVEPGRSSRSVELPNEEMQQTKPAFFLDCAGFAADLRCSADSGWTERGRLAVRHG